LVALFLLLFIVLIFMKLSKRLKAIADYIKPGANVVDIGTDHGYLPVYLIVKNLANKVIASDISAASLSAAKRLADDYFVSDKIIFKVASGLCGIKPGEVDTVVISGLGGETIAYIINEYPSFNTENIAFILQPQSKLDILYRFLYNNGYNIEHIKYLHDKGKRYNIIKVTGRVINEMVV